MTQNSARLLFAESNGVRCRCGRIGCLETVAGSPALVKRMEDGLAEGRFPLVRREWETGAELSVGLLAKSAAQGDPDAAAEIAHISRRVGEAAAAAVTLLNPEKLILSGELGEAPGFAEGLLSELRAHCVVPASGLEKIFLDGGPSGTYHGGSLLCNEGYSFQFACTSVPGLHSSWAAWMEAEVTVESDIKGHLDVYLAEQVPAALPTYPRYDEGYLRTAPGLYPDPLFPLAACRAENQAPCRKVEIDLGPDERGAASRETYGEIDADSKGTPACFSRGRTGSPACSAAGADPALYQLVSL